MEKPFFSIIVPLHKTNPVFLNELVLSLRNQTFDNFECLFIQDDHSADDFPLEDLRFSLISIPPAPVGKSRNVGLNEAKGKYIVFIDSDDCVAFDFLETGFRLSQQYPHGIVAFDHNRDKNWGSTSTMHVNSQPSERLHHVLLAEFGCPPVSFRPLLCTVWAKCIPAWVIGSTRFSEEEVASEDCKFMAVVGMNCPEIILVTGYRPYFYRPNPASLIHSLDWEKIGLFLSLQQEKDILSKLPLSEEEKQMVALSWQRHIICALNDAVRMICLNSKSKLSVFQRSRIIRRAMDPNRIIYAELKTLKSGLGPRYRLMRRMLLMRCFFLYSFLLGIVHPNRSSR